MAESWQQLYFHLRHRGLSAVRDNDESNIYTCAAVAVHSGCAYLCECPVVVISHRCVAFVLWPVPEDSAHGDDRDRVGLRYAGRVGCRRSSAHDKGAPGHRPCSAGKFWTLKRVTLEGLEHYGIIRDSNQLA